jgi:hypothetical protein
MGQTVAQWLKANKGKYKDGDTLKAECIKATGAHRDSVVRVMRRAGLTTAATAPTPSACNKGGVSVDEFRARHDPLYRMRQAVKLLTGQRLWPEAEFRERLAGLDTTKFRSKADLQEFERFHGRANGITYWAAPSVITSLKADGSMQ